MNFKYRLMTNKNQYRIGLSFLNDTGSIGNNPLNVRKLIARIPINEFKLEDNLTKLGNVLFDHTSKTRVDTRKSAVFIDKTSTKYCALVISRIPQDVKLSQDFVQYRTNIIDKSMFTSKKRLPIKNWGSVKWKKIMPNSILRDDNSQRYYVKFERVLNVKNHIGFMFSCKQLSHQVASEIVGNCEIVQTVRTNYKPFCLNRVSSIEWNNFVEYALSLVNVLRVGPLRVYSNSFLRWRDTSEVNQ